ncbi:hypothetical protein D5R81_08455 [Parashewanella spongiae]|uniref:Plasmid pRiA4b Orf3-like domain-containing protein n=1 Tax=Parashewanella spongiae TaxID=342950 RepID=A0A3A6U7M3_9GAMM|nr:hypothetical protein [Parashewanella spongiae]MCL1078023.1 plasmid pRiA4b ORF-3 family protein [Parashewanella spongiae]RJY17457.1 hypothetical protein D5R81_08455 [Parashewanella spongiae]
MIITLSIECLPHPFFDDEFQRVIEIDESTTLEELHHCIQEIIDFENDHMYEFFIARNPHEKRTVVFCDEEMVYHDNVMSIDDTQLDGAFPLESKQNFFYYFDFGDSWIFQIKRTRHKAKTVEKGINYPRVVKSIGEAPVQYPDWDDE